jgi:hypothetical protein
MKQFSWLQYKSANFCRIQLSASSSYCLVATYNISRKTDIADLKCEESMYGFNTFVLCFVQSSSEDAEMVDLAEATSSTDAS